MSWGIHVTRMHLGVCMETYRDIEVEKTKLQPTVYQLEKNPELEMHTCLAGAQLASGGGVEKQMVVTIS